MEVITLTSYPGTNILLGTEKRNLNSLLAQKAREHEFEEVTLPIIHPLKMIGNSPHNSEAYKAGDNDGKMYCLSPEYISLLANVAGTKDPDWKVFYIQECFRQVPVEPGNWRQFTQFGIHVFNPTKNYGDFFKQLTMEIINYCNPANVSINNFDMHEQLPGPEFQITSDLLGDPHNEVVAGGRHQDGIGVVFGVDRLMMAQGYFNQ